MLLGGGKDEDGVRRRFLKSLQEGIESRRREHMHLVYDIDAVLAHLRRDLNLVHQFLDGIDTIVRSGIKLVYAV